MTTTMKIMLSIFTFSIMLAITFTVLGEVTFDDKREEIFAKASIVFWLIWVCSIIGTILTWIWGW